MIGLKSNNVLDSEIYVDNNNGIIPLIEVFISKRNGKKNHCYGGRSRIMKYKVGDKVRVRKDLEQKIYGGFYVTQEMLELKGKEVTITEVNKSGYSGKCGYRVDIGGLSWHWTDEMFEDDIKNSNTAMTVEDLLNKTDVESGGLIITIYYPNAYFEATIGHNKINRNSELYKRFIKAYGDMIVDEVSFDIRNENMVVMLIKVDYAD
jgi:hypothetical protein